MFLRGSVELSGEECDYSRFFFFVYVLLVTDMSLE